MKIVYQGYYGEKNSGDDAFVDIAAWGATKYWKCNKHLFFASQLPKIKTEVTCLNPYKNYYYFSKAILNVFSSDIYVSAGGSTFHSSLKESDMRTYAKLSKRLKIKGIVGAIGVSLGPYKNTDAEKSTISYLKQIDFLALRDRYSYELACSYNLPYNPIEAFDLAALLPIIYPYECNSKTSNTKILGISICNYESYTRGDTSKEIQRNIFIQNILEHFKKDKSVKLRFFIFNGNPIIGDKQITEDIIHKLSLKAGVDNYEIIPYLDNVRKTFEKIQECNVVISTRLHASIFACFADVPFFLLEYHRKCTDFLTDIGQSSQYRVYNGEFEIKKTISEIENILHNDIYTAPLHINSAKDKALKNFTETLFY